MRFVVKPPIGSVLLLALYCSSECHDQHSCVFTMQDSLDGIEEELSRVGPTLQRYSKLTLRPSVSFAQDSPDSPLPAQAFLSQMECTEDGGVEGDPWVRNWMESVRYGKVTWLNLYTVTIPWHSKKCKMLSITFVILRYQINWLMRGSVSILATDVVLLVGFTQWGLRRKKQTQTNMSYTEISVTSDIEGVHHTNPDWGLRFCVSSAGNFMFWGCLSGKSPLHKVCDTLQQAGIGPQQLLVR